MACFDLLENCVNVHDAFGNGARQNNRLVVLHSAKLYQILQKLDLKTKNRTAGNVHISL